MSATRTAPAAGASKTPLLLEREHDLRAFESALASAAAGRGGLLLVDGPIGIGKTTLLQAAAALARARGVSVYTARAAALEQDFSYGVVRQLYAPLRLEHDGVELTGAARLALRAFRDSASSNGIAREGVSFATLHGLYWLTADLAGQSPLLLVVDDCHWADAPSLRFLAHLGRRLDGVPVLLLVARRTGESAADPALVDELLSLADGKPIHPAPLGEAAASRLVRTSLGPEASDGFCLACHSATGGNPLLLLTLLAAVAEDGRPVGDDDVEQIAELAGESTGRVLSRQLTRLPAGCEAVAQSLAVLGAGAPLRQVAALADLELEEVAELVDALRAAAVLAPDEPLDFAHPVLRAAAGDTMTAAERARAHERAVELLAAEGAPADRLALHLLHTHARGDPGVVATLRAGARIAADRGAPDTTASYLRRALEESPPAAERGPLLLELGLALMAAWRDPQAPGLLEEAIRLTADPEPKLEAALLAGRALAFQSAVGISVRLLETGLAGGMGSSQRARLVEAELMAQSSILATSVADVRNRLDRHLDEDPAESAAEGVVSLVRAMHDFAAIHDVQGIGNRVERALAGPALGSGSVAVTPGLMVLVWLDRLDVVEKISLQLVEEGKRRGDVGFVGHYAWTRGLALAERGSLRDAESDARWVHELKLGLRSPGGLLFTLSALMAILLDGGQVQAAADALEEAEGVLAAVELPDELEDMLCWALTLEQRGRLRIEQGALECGLADLAEAELRWRALGIRNPLAARWREYALPALLRLGDAEKARSLATEELELARETGLPRALAIANRLSALAEPRQQELALLAEAVELLEQSPARLEYARALVDHGAALRRAGRRRDAQARLRPALELAHRCGAAGLAARAREELVAAGARPRRPVFTGVEALTASERRAARLAAQGRSNREIAETLFVTQRTVETHLRHTFQKLGITSRSELPPELGAAH
jgi:DNA-binding CsgD family transcriptional regulator